MTDFWLVFISYIVGSCPFAYFAGYILKGVDIRKVGDRNAGASNVYRHISHRAGIAVLLTDIAKGAIVILAAQAITSPTTVLLCGIAVVAGHDWPVFLKFKGGRGLATSLGVLIALLPKEMIILLVVAALPFWKTRDLVVMGAIVFAPLPVLAWRLGAPGILILYSVGLPCFAGFIHLLTTRHLPDKAKSEARYMR